MNKLKAVLGFWVLSVCAAQADEIETCITFDDRPPGLTDHLLCEKEEQHSAKLDLPASDDQTVLTLTELYELGWSLLTMQRFETEDGRFLYRLYFVQET